MRTDPSTETCELEEEFISCDNCGAPMPKMCNITCPKCGHKHDCGEH